MTSYSISLTILRRFVELPDVWCTKSALLPPGVSLKSTAVAFEIYHIF